MGHRSSGNHLLLWNSPTARKGLSRLVLPKFPAAALRADISTDEPLRYQTKVRARVQVPWQEWQNWYDHCKGGPKLVLRNDGVMPNDAEPYRHVYKHVRPHQNLGQVTPIDVDLSDPAKPWPTLDELAP